MRLIIQARDCEVAATAAAVTPTSTFLVSTSVSFVITAPKLKPPTFWMDDLSCLNSVRASGVKGSTSSNSSTLLS